MKIKLFTLCFVIACLPACAWIEVSNESRKVTLVKSFHVKDCVKLGTTDASVTHKIGIIIRADEAVTDDLVKVAKNRAAEMGGDSIVAKGPAVEGKMSFNVYRCGSL